jgi:hypothetical protein
MLFNGSELKSDQKKQNETLYWVEPTPHCFENHQISSTTQTLRIPVRKTTSYLHLSTCLNHNAVPTPWSRSDI